MGQRRKEIGSEGERIAARYLRRRGHRILATNYRSVCGEIDIITMHNGLYVFVEVKTRTSFSFGPPSLSVTWKKQRHIIRSALCYLKRYGAADSPWRIDVVSVMLDHALELSGIEHIENAVEE